MIFIFYSIYYAHGFGQGRRILVSGQVAIIANLPYGDNCIDLSEINGSPINNIDFGTIGLCTTKSFSGGLGVRFRYNFFRTWAGMTGVDFNIKREVMKRPDPDPDLVNWRSINSYRSEIPFYLGNFNRKLSFYVGYKAVWLESTKNIRVTESQGKFVAYNSDLSTVHIRFQPSFGMACKISELLNHPFSVYFEVDHHDEFVPKSVRGSLDLHIGCSFVW